MNVPSRKKTSPLTPIKNLSYVALVSRTSNEIINDDNFSYNHMKLSLKKKTLPYFFDPLIRY